MSDSNNKNNDNNAEPTGLKLRGPEEEIKLHVTKEDVLDLLIASMA